MTQPINALAFVFDGINYGASDFAYSAYSMVSVKWYANKDLVVLEIILCTASQMMKLHLYKSLVFKKGIVSDQTKKEKMKGPC